jgi:hypothetical protein
MAARLDDLVGEITDLRPDAYLLVASIIPIELSDEMNDLVKRYNEQIRDVIVPRYQRMGRNVSFVDQYDNFVDNAGRFIPGALPDGKHPNGPGYDRMAETWFRAIDRIERERAESAPPDKTDESDETGEGGAPPNADNTDWDAGVCLQQCGAAPGCGAAVLSAGVPWPFCPAAGI